MVKRIFFSLLLSLVFCLTAEAKQLTVFTTNDIHGRLLPFDYNDEKDVGGAARRTNIFRTVPNALILDAGDYAQGTLYFKVLKHNLNLEVLSYQGYNAITLGNHEFDKGISYIEKSAKATNIPFLAANIEFKNKELNNLIQDYTIKEVNDLKIGIIGVLDSGVKATSSTNPNTYDVLDEIKTLKKAVKKIDKKTDLIIVLSHCGLEKDKIIAKEVKGIDLIIGGHSHSLIKKPLKIKQADGDIVLISQNGEFGRVVGKWDLTVENDKIVKHKFEHISVNADIPEDETTKQIIEKYDKKLEDFAATVAGYSLTPIDSRRTIVKTRLTTAGALLHKAIRFYYPDIDISFNTSGGYRYGGFLPQLITNKDVKELFPFDSYLVILNIKGSDIKEILETSSRFLPKPASSFLQSYGISYTVNLNAQPKILNSSLDKIIRKGARVSQIYINGIPLDENKYYKVATDSFMYYGGDGYIEFKKYENVKHTYFFLDKILIRYLQSNSPVSAEVLDKIRIVK